MANNEVDFEKSLNQIKISADKYSIYLQKLVNDLKKKNHPLDKKYLKQPDLRWFKYRSWYHASIGDEKIVSSIDWTTFVYAVYHDLKKDEFVLNMNKKIKILDKNNKESLFSNWLLEVLFIFFSEEKDEFFTRQKLVKYLISAIKNEKPIIKTRSLLAGIILETNEVIIDKNLKIRKAKKQDLEFSLKMGEDSHDYDRTVEESFCVLELTYKKDDEHTYSWDKLKKIELILQLFKLSSAKCTVTVEKSSGIEFVNKGTSRLGFYPKTGIMYYAKIKDDEIEYLKRFYKIMQKRLTKRMINYFFESDEIEIALSRFTKGLNWIHHTQSSVSYAVMTVEALLINSEGDQKLRFALKSSKLLSLIGLDMKQVFENMSLAYDVRSKYVHGDKMSENTLKKIKKRFKDKEIFAFTIMDYARLIIAVYLILNQSKDSLYKMLEDTQFGKNEKQFTKTLKPVLKYLKIDNYKPKFRHWAIHKVNYLTE